MSQKRYKVVEAKWQGSQRVEIDIGLQAKPEPAAKKELRELQAKHPARTFSLQLQGSCTKPRK